MKKLILALLFSSSVCFGQIVVTTPIANFPNISNPLSYYLFLVANPGVTNYNITMAQFCAYLTTQGFQSGPVKYSMTNGTTTATNTVNGCVHIVDTNMNETITGTFYPTNTLTVATITSLPFTNDWAWIGRMSNYMMEISMSNNAVTFTRLGP